jgi:FlaA1/EpsC-like NDP-sugar epimerase
VWFRVVSWIVFVFSSLLEPANASVEMRAERVKHPRIQASTVRVPGRAPQWVIPTVKLALVVGDALIAAFSFVGAFYFREGASIFERTANGGFQWSRQFAPYGAMLLFVVLIRLLVLHYYDLYRLRGEFSFFDDAVRLFKSIAIGSLLIVAAAFLYRGGFQYRAFSYARAVFVLDFLLAFAGIVTLRLMVRALQMFARQRQLNLIPTLVVGQGPEAALCIKEMRDRPSLGYRVIGVVENSVGEGSGQATYEGVRSSATWPDCQMLSATREPTK